MLEEVATILLTLYSTFLSKVTEFEKENSNLYEIPFLRSDILLKRTSYTVPSTSKSPLSEISNTLSPR